MQILQTKHEVMPVLPHCNNNKYSRYFLLQKVVTLHLHFMVNLNVDNGLYNKHAKCTSLYNTLTFLDSIL